MRVNLPYIRQGFTSLTVCEKCAYSDVVLFYFPEFAMNTERYEAFCENTSRLWIIGNLKTCSFLLIFNSSWIQTLLTWQTSATFRVTGWLDQFVGMMEKHIQMNASCVMKRVSKSKPSKKFQTEVVWKVSLYQ